MSDATDDLDYQLSGGQEAFRRLDKELWEEQKRKLTSKSLSEPLETPSELTSIHANEVKGIDCPSCGHPCLMLANGYITCTLADCPNPDYAEAIERLIADEVRKAFESVQNEINEQMAAANDNLAYHVNHKHSERVIKEWEGTVFGIKLIDDAVAQLSNTKGETE